MRVLNKDLGGEPQDLVLDLTLSFTTCVTLATSLNLGFVYFDLDI